ncbi:vesicle-associated membrane protein 7-like [Leptidea sinapis]|uniref:vesicle-associated membrane protein 7-like n=1 Tax=Leptidea sinapis TaxID=189913 RepID=UPI0021C44622|nr:vesicle-associated membrane protein 7-like [Leptidea sinapis]
MPILFSAFACDRVIVNKFASCEGNFDEIVETMLIKLPQNNRKMTYSHGKYLLHYIVEDRLFYFCVTDRTCQRSRAFLFLNEIRRRHRTDFKNNFADVMAEEMFRYNEDYSTIVVRNGELDEVNTIAVDSSENILGEKILLVENELNLKYTTTSYVEEKPQQVTLAEDKGQTNQIVFVAVIFVGLSVLYVISPVTFTAIIVLFILRTINR